MKNYILGVITGAVTLLLALAASDYRRQIREQTHTEE